MTMLNTSWNYGVASLHKAKEFPFGCIFIDEVPVMTHLQYDGIAPSTRSRQLFLTQRMPYDWKCSFHRWKWKTTGSHFGSSPDETRHNITRLRTTRYDIWRSHFTPLVLFIWVNGVVLFVTDPIQIRRRNHVTWKRQSQLVGGWQGTQPLCTVLCILQSIIIPIGRQYWLQQHMVYRYCIV